MPSTTPSNENTALLGGNRNSNRISLRCGSDKSSTMSLRKSAEIGYKTHSIYSTGKADNEVNGKDVPNFGKDTSWWSSIFSIVTTAIGAGIVTLPVVFEGVGYVMATFLTILCAIMSIEAGWRYADVVKKLEETNEEDEDVSTSAVITRRVFSPKLVGAYEGFYHAFIFLIGAVFMFLLAKNFYILFDSLPFMAPKGWMLAVTLILMFLCWIRDVSSLAKVSVLAWASCFVVIICVIINVIIKGVPEDPATRAVAYNPPKFTTSGLETRDFFNLHDFERSEKISHADQRGDFLWRIFSESITTDEKLTAASATYFDENIVFIDSSAGDLASSTTNSDVASSRSLKLSTAFKSHDDEGKPLPADQLSKKERLSHDMNLVEMKNQPLNRKDDFLPFQSWAAWQGCQYGKSCLTAKESRYGPNAVVAEQLSMAKSATALSAIEKSAVVSTLTGGNKDRFEANRKAAQDLKSVDLKILYKPRDAKGDASSQWQKVPRDLKDLTTGDFNFLERMNDDASLKDKTVGSPLYDAKETFVGCELRLQWKPRAVPRYGDNAFQEFLVYYRVFEDSNGYKKGESDEAPKMCREGKLPGGLELNLANMGAYVPTSTAPLMNTNFRSRVFVVSGFDKNKKVQKDDGAGQVEVVLTDNKVQKIYGRWMNSEFLMLNQAQVKPEVVEVMKNILENVTSAEGTVFLKGDEAIPLGDKACLLIADSRSLTGKATDISGLYVFKYSDKIGSPELYDRQKEACETKSNWNSLREDLKSDADAVTRRGEIEANLSVMHPKYSDHVAKQWYKLSVATLETKKLDPIPEPTGPNAEAEKKKIALGLAPATGEPPLVRESVLDPRDIAIMVPNTKDLSTWKKIRACLSWLIGASNTIFFSFTFVIMVPSLYVSMIEPAGIYSSIGVSCGTVAIIYVIVGLTGYIAYGSGVQASIIDSMRETYVNHYNHNPSASWLGLIVSSMIVLNVFISFALIMNQTLLTIEMALCKVGKPEDVPVGKSKLIRTLMIWAAGIVVLFIPAFLYLVGFVAAFGCVVTQVPYPIMAYGRMFERSKSQTVWHYFLLVFSAISVLYGVVDAVADLVTGLINEFSGDPTPFYDRMPIEQGWWSRNFVEAKFWYST